MEREAARQGMEEGGMTPGELTVIGVRAQTLADELRRSRTLAFVASLNPKNGPARRNPFWLYGRDLARASQRLQSSIERALGTRGRHYDDLR